MRDTRQHNPRWYAAPKEASRENVSPSTCRLRKPDAANGREHDGPENPTAYSVQPHRQVTVVNHSGTQGLTAALRQGGANAYGMKQRRNPALACSAFVSFFQSVQHCLLSPRGRLSL